MLTIDRYILRQFLKVLLVCFLSLTGLFVVIDVFSNLDEFLGMAARHGGLPALLCEYYGARSLTFFDRTSGLMGLMAAAFVATHLVRSNELPALLAAGIPKIRVVAPLLGAAMVVSLLAAVNREAFIPPLRDKLMRNAQDWEGSAEKKLDPRYDNRTDVLINGHHTLAAEQCIVHPTFRRQPEMGQFGAQLMAGKAYYRPPGEGHPGGYLLCGVQQPKGLAEIPSFCLDKTPVVLSPSDTPWLEADQCFVVSEITFEQLAAGSAWRQFSSTAELIAGLRNPSLDFAADVRVAVHARLLQPLLDMTLVCLGLPVVLARQNRNVFVAAGMCLLIVAVFILIVLACHAAGHSYLISPALAAWCPLLILAPFARLSMQGLWQ
jgi:lipopolysaccharide export system permease protein